MRLTACKQVLVTRFGLSTMVATISVVCVSFWMKKNGSSSSKRILKSFCLAFSGLVIATVSLLNFSLAVATAVLIVLPYSVMSSRPGWLFRCVQWGALLVLSPPGIATIIACVTGMDLGDLLSILIKDYRTVSSWLLLYVCFAYWPTNMAMQILVLS